MANGRLGTLIGGANTDITLYQNATGSAATVTVSFCNTGANPTAVRLALSTSAVISLGDYLEYDAVIAPSGVLERTGIVVGPSQFLIARVSQAACTAVVYGFEG